MARTAPHKIVVPPWTRRDFRGVLRLLPTLVQEESRFEFPSRTSTRTTTRTISGEHFEPLTGRCGTM
jgi:hypothetical protein